MILFGLLGSTMGMFEETYGLIPVFISIAMALGYDAIVGGSVIYLGVAVGFAAAPINPFTIGIAQEVAGVKMFSGLGYRILCFVVFMGISIWYVWRYARRIQKDPTKSYLYGEKIETLECASREEMMEIKMTTTHKLSCLLFVFTIGMLLYGTIKLGWYIRCILARYHAPAFPRYGKCTGDVICSEHYQLLYPKWCRTGSDHNADPCPSRRNGWCQPSGQRPGLPVW